MLLFYHLFIYDMPIYFIMILCYHSLQLSSEGIGLQQVSPATGIWVAAKNG